MSFNYDKHKNSDDHGSVWTSYSDLFLGLSIIFLLLYVTVSLRQGTSGIQQQFENKKLTQQNDDLKQQLKVYEALKQDYLKNSANEQEMSSYEDLMKHLDLLQEKANEEKTELRKQALDNEKKEQALNKYQQMIRNIINSNMVAKGRIKTRDQIIVTKEEQIKVSKTEIKSLEQTVAEKKAQLAVGEQKIQIMNQELDQRLKQLRATYKHQKMTLKNFEKQKQALEEDAQKRVAELRAKNAAVAQQLGDASRELGETSAKLGKTNAKLAQVEGALGQSNARLAQTQGDLARAQENLNARKKLAAQIKGNFAAAGVKADVDAGTGDVLLSFGDHYFDTDRADLKPEMMKIIKKAMPSYSKSLFQDKKIAEKIQNVEIVGFASPTYKGKFIDPRSLEAQDRQAVNYNLDLSYARAKAIFNVVFDQKKMSFEHQKELLPLVKVTGRSFFSNPDGKRDPAASGSFCEKNDCAKLQRVIIKFNLKD